jgi:hypothetical protein
MVSVVWYVDFYVLFVLWLGTSGGWGEGCLGLENHPPIPPTPYPLPQYTPEAKYKVPVEYSQLWHRVAHGKCVGVDSGVDIR